MTDTNRDRENLRPHPTLTDYYQDEGQRRHFVSRLFDRTARHYNWINRVMSFGTGERYRRDAMLRAGLLPGMAVLDVCIGTGQVARPALRVTGAEGSVIGLDASFGMLAEAQHTVPAPLVQALVEQLPVRSDSFDLVTMGYALRHVTDLGQVFSEYRRVLKPGGKLLILELTRPRSRLLYHIIRIYLHRVVPAIARLGSGTGDARTLMRYFWDTIDSCVPPATIIDALSGVGLNQANRYCMAGIFSEYTAVKSPG
jgi:demethylmenaquinone methyltransferase/2-methoxy-6-polyprenyl-1,4-benzoquinol methylase